MAGLKQGVTRNVFKMGLQSGNLEPLVHRMPVKAGESIFIPSGRIHAIGGGNLILEIQQNSDTTYRVYDWGRVGLDGSPRELHIKESLRSTDFNDFEPETLKSVSGNQLLAESDVFDLKKISLKRGEHLQFEAGSPRILSLVSGELQEADGSTISTSANALLPAAHAFDFVATTVCQILLTENFA
jgi:mannose-6-phosphate isomerase